MVRVWERVDGDRQLLSAIPFAEWENPHFASSTPGRIAAQVVIRFTPQFVKPGFCRFKRREMFQRTAVFCVVRPGFQVCDDVEAPPAAVTLRYFPHRSGLLFQDKGHGDDFACMWDIILSLLRSDWFMACIIPHLRGNIHINRQTVIGHAAWASSWAIRSLARRAYSSVTSMPVAV